jgi:hypothetical protein
MTVEIVRNVRAGLATPLGGKAVGRAGRGGSGGGWERQCGWERPQAMRSSARGAGLVGHRDLAAEFGLSPHTVRLWVRSGLWPLPRLVCGAVLYFPISDVECWVRTGIWPGGVVFRRTSRAGVLERIP